MRRFRTSHGRYGLVLPVVVVALLAILLLQYVSSRRLAEVEEIARQTTLTRFLGAVTADVRRFYEEGARQILDVPAGVLAAKRFDEVARGFDRADTSMARLVFAGALDGCLCLTRYYDPATGTMSIGADADTEAVVMRASTLLRAGTLLPARQRLRLNGSDLHVDEVDSENRAIFRFVADSEAGGEQMVGIVGLVIDARRFEREYLPRAISSAMELLREGIRDNLIVRTTDPAGRVVTATHVEPGQTDVQTGRFDFVFRDWEVSARSRHTAAAHLVRSGAFTHWVLTVLMSVTVLGGVLLTWRAAGRERRLSRIRNAFVANASHELRTPLASIALFGEFLRRGRVESPAKVVEYGRHIEHESNRLQRLIDNVLDFARIESAAMKYRRRKAVIEDVVKDAVRAVDVRRERDGFAIAVAGPATPLPAVCIDPPAMTQVLVNLLDNAMKYSGRSRSIRVDLSVRGDRVAVSVIDFGIGIDRDDHERVFHEFYRSAGDGVAGTGLGLAIVRHIVQAHEGAVEVDSRPGQGSTFTILIPVADTAPHRWRAGVDAGRDRTGLEIGAGA